MFYTNMILLAFVVSFIVDVSGFVQSVRPGINAALHRDPDARLRPFDCSTCVCFWSGVVLCIFAGFTFPHLAFVCACAYCERFLTQSVFMIGEAINDLLAKLSKRL